MDCGRAARSQFGNPPVPQHSGASDAAAWENTNSSSVCNKSHFLFTERPCAAPWCTSSALVPFLPPSLYEYPAAPFVFPRLLACTASPRRVSPPPPNCPPSTGPSTSNHGLPAIIILFRASSYSAQAPGRFLAVTATQTAASHAGVCPRETLQNQGQDTPQGQEEEDAVSSLDPAGSIDRQC